MIVSEYQLVIRNLMETGFRNYIVDSVRPFNDDVMVTLINPESFEEGKDSYMQTILVMSKAGVVLKFHDNFVDV